jgi:hypothetical protein
VPSDEAIARHPHLAAPVAPGRIRADLHTHTMWSGDSTTTPDEFAAAVEASGLDVVCVTDHNAIDGANELRDRLDCRVVVGEELRTAAGEIIGLFLTERVPMGISHLDAARAIRDQGGVVYIPHPFDPMRRNLTEAALYELAEAASEFAAEFGIVGGAGSDGHVPDALGAAYVEMADFATPMEFLASLAGADVIGHHWDEPRRWSPRIVPSVTPGGS